ncbi:MAG: fkbp-type peptidyl-prolyl cis-trans isomerase FkpA, partial [Pseudomonadota bacterium]
MAPIPAAHAQAVGVDPEPDEEAEMTFCSVPPVAAALALLLAGPALAQSAAPSQPPQEAPAGQEQLDPQKAFLVENAKKKGVKTTPSGLQFRILKDGEFGAKSPKSTDAVLVHYE